MGRQAFSIAELYGLFVTSVRAFHCAYRFSTVCRGVCAYDEKSKQPFSCRKFSQLHEKRQLAVHTREVTALYPGHLRHCDASLPVHHHIGQHGHK